MTYRTILTADHLKEMHASLLAEVASSESSILRFVRTAQFWIYMAVVTAAALIVLNAVGHKYQWIGYLIALLLIGPVILTRTLQGEFPDRLAKCVGQERAISVSDTDVLLGSPDFEVRIRIQDICGLAPLSQSSVILLSSGGRVWIPVGPSSTDEAARTIMAAIRDRAGSKS